MASTKQTVADFLKNFRPNFTTLISEINKSCNTGREKIDTIDCSESLKSFLQKYDFTVENLTTSGFSATFSRPAQFESVEKRSHENDEVHVGDKPLHVVIIIDPMLKCNGDSCGRKNLCDTNSLSSGIGTGLCIRFQLEKMAMIGKVTILAIPGANNGDCDQLDMGLVKHATLVLNPVSSTVNSVYPTSFCMLDVTVRFQGKELNVHMPPLFEGRNAVDAAVSCYTNVALLRPHLPPQWVVNGMICDCGDTTGHTIPAETSLKFWMRAQTTQELVMLQQRCNGCFDAARKSSGCSMTIGYGEQDFVNMWPNEELAMVFTNFAEQLGMKFEDCDSTIGPTIVGKISHQVPVLNVVFADKSIDPENGVDPLQVAQAMTLTTLTLTSDVDIHQKVMADFYTARRADSLPIQMPRNWSGVSESSTPVLTRRQFHVGDDKH